MATHQYWRALGIEAYDGGAAIELSEFWLLDGALRVDAIAALTGSVPPLSGSLANLQDNDTSSSATLAAGTYSLWATPDADDWTMSFNSNAVRFHLAVPAGGEVLAVHAKPVTSAEHTETLLFAFPMTDADSARLELRWGTTVVPFAIKALR